MATLPPIRRLLLDDFPGQKAWIEPLLYVYNNFAESVVNTLNKSLSLHDNTTGDILNLTLSAVPTTATPATITWTKNITPRAIDVGQATLLNGSAPTVTAAMGITWLMSGNAIQITNLFGVVPTPTAMINLTLVVLAG